MIRIFAVLLLFLGFASYGQSQTSVDKETRYERRVKHILNKVNKLRTSGCRCGGKRMPKVKALTWNDKLEYSAYLHAKEMHEYDYFGHRSLRGEDVADRVEKIGYDWQNVGENLAVGQKNLDEAMKDWIESDSHCRMLMDSKMKEMGLARVGKYWVHHFGTVKPPKTKRVRKRYREG